MENEKSIDNIAGKMMSACTLCPRECHVDRSSGKKVSAGWMGPFIWQEQHCICGRNPAFPEQKVPERYSFPDAGCAAVSVRIMILPLGAEDWR